MIHKRRLGLVVLALITAASLRAETVKAGDEIPLNMNSLVVRELDRLQTPDGQKHYQAAKQRMPIYRGLIEGMLEQAGMPRTLLVVPFIESGYRNLQFPGQQSAGLWQIMPETGRRLGLVVDDETDERLNEKRATEAALKYLKELNARFGDWRLALLAYNRGENKVQQLIEALGTHDAWALEEQEESPERYLSKFTANALQLKSDGVLP